MARRMLLCFSVMTVPALALALLHCSSDDPAAPASTIDSGNDSSVAIDDAGTDSPAVVKQVPCGDAGTCSSPDTCCLDSVTGAAACTPLSSCKGSAVECLGTSSCAGGEICCMAAPGTTLITLTCHSGTQCPASLINGQLCSSPSDCAGGAACIPYICQGAEQTVVTPMCEGTLGGSFAYICSPPSDAGTDGGDAGDGG